MVPGFVHFGDGDRGVNNCDSVRLRRLLLRARRERPRGRAAEQRDELAAIHVAPVAQDRFDIANFSARSNEPLLSPGEYDRHRACILDHLACGSEQPRCSVYSKCDNGVAPGKVTAASTNGHTLTTTTPL